MYILILVSAMLMLLNIMTATRFATFLDGERVRLAYEQYMRERERSYINKTERKEYNDKRKDRKTAIPRIPQNTEKDKTPKPSPPPPPPPATNSVSKLNIYPLIADKLPADSQLWVDGTERLLAAIIQNGYGDQKFVLQRGDPVTVAHHLIEEFIIGAKKGACDIKIEKIEDIANISFQNEDDRRLYYLLIKGAEPPKGSKGEGYPSLYDYLTYKQSDKITPIQVAKASKPLLQAIFSGSEDAVDRILSMRGDLQKRLENKELTPTEAKQLLEQASGGILANPNVPAEMLDFSVSEKED